MDREAFSIMGSDSGSQHRTLAIAAIALGKIVELGLPADRRAMSFVCLRAGHNQKLRDEIRSCLRSRAG